MSDPLPDHLELDGPGHFPTPIVGESNYQAALEAIAGGRTADSLELFVTAMIYCESDNPDDSLAVRVAIDGRTVGYLDRANAPKYRAMIERAWGSVPPAKCKAVIRGGWDRGPGDRGHFGVWLDI